MGKRGHVRECAWRGCNKATDDIRRFGRRRPVNPNMPSALLKDVPHSDVLCNAQGQVWDQHLKQSDAAVAEADGLEALLSAAAAPAAPSSPSPSLTAAISSFDSLRTAGRVNSQPLLRASPPYALSTAASPRRALSDISLNTPMRRDQRRHSTPLKKKKQMVRAVSAATTAAQRQAVLERFRIRDHDVQQPSGTSSFLPTALPSCSRAIRTSTSCSRRCTRSSGRSGMRRRAATGRPRRATPRRRVRLR
jgi:hypothetical protein